MPNALCAGTCPAPANLSGFYQCKSVTRSANIKFLIFIKCTYQFTDILDVAEWVAAIASGDVVCSAPADIVITPSEDEIKTSCDTYTTANLEYDIAFTSFETVVGSVTDQIFYDDLFDNAGKYGVMWFDCNDGDERFALQRDWAAAIDAGAPATVAGTSPALPFSFISRPQWIKGDGDLGTWVMTLKYRPTDNKSYTTRLLAGVAAVCQ